MTVHSECLNWGGLVLVFLASVNLIGQSTGATFGDVISLGGTPSDIVLDESSGRARMRHFVYVLRSEP